MTTAEARTAVKLRLGIPSATTTFDTLIDDAVVASVRRLYPKAGLEVDKQTISSVSPDDLGEVEVTLASYGSIKAARQVEAYNGYGWERVDDTFHHGTTLRLRGISDSITQIRIYGIKNFPTIDDVYDHLLQAVIWYAMAEFYDYLAGSKADYNIYMQASGARAVDNLRDESAYYDAKAGNYLDEQKQAYGL